VSPIPGAERTAAGARGGAGYLLDNRDEQASARFEALSTLFDAVTFRHLAALGIPVGARCWVVGAGGPSVAAWMAGRVGQEGSVVATDIDVSRIGEFDGGIVEVLEHDVAADEPPAGGFDCIHARLVLVHVPGRDEALRKMVSALRPGGWLLIEDLDPLLLPFACPDPGRPEEHRANRVREGFLELLDERGADLAYGRTLPRLLRRHDLLAVGADAYVPVALGASNLLERANVSQVHEALVARGFATSEEIDDHLRAVIAGEIDISVPPLVSAWGRRR
jgi:SAM-dependent methyltransferase